MLRQLKFQILTTIKTHIILVINSYNFDSLNDPLAICQIYIKTRIQICST